MNTMRSDNDDSITPVAVLLSTYSGVMNNASFPECVFTNTSHL